MGRNIHYSWIILSFSIPIAIISVGVVYSYGVFLKPLETEFGWGRAAITGAAGLYMFVHLIVAPFTGWLTDRFGPRMVIGAGGILTGLGLVLTSQVNAVWQLYFYYGVIVGLGMGCIDVPILTAIAKWFLQRRGLAMGIFFAGGGVGMMIMSPVAGGLVAAYGWRPSFLFIGIISWIIIVACSQFLKKRVQDTGSLSAEVKQPEGQETAVALTGLTLQEAIRTSTFWSLFSAYTFWSIATMMMTYHLIAHAEDQGISSVTAASILSIIGGVGIGSRLGIGVASDRWGRKPFLFMSFVGMGLLLFWLAWCTSFWMFCLFGILWGISNGGVGPVIMSWIGELFGMKHLGVIVGLLAAEFGLGAAVGPPLAGYIYDTIGTYTPAFTIGAVMMLIAASIVFLLRPPKIQEMSSE